MNISISLTSSISCFFRQELREARELSRHTYRSYTITIKSFATFLQKKLRKALPDILTDEVTYELIYDWMIYHKKQKKWSAYTWNRYLAAIKTFVRYLAKSNLRYLDLSSRVDLIQSQKLPKKKPSYLPLCEFEKILKKIKTYREVDFRDKLMFQILFFSGARVEEFTGIRLQDLVWLDRASVSIHLSGKGRKERTVIVKEKGTLQNLRRYIDRRISSGISTEYLFPSRFEKRMSEENMRRIVRKHFGHLETKHITPHSFRHSAAMNWLENGMGIYKVSILLGHEDISTTTRYLRATMKIKNDALDSAGQNMKLSHIFKTNYGSNEEFWESLGVDLI